MSVGDNCRPVFVICKVVFVYVMHGEYSGTMADTSKALTSLYLKHKSLQCKNLHDYLKTLPPVILERLYNHPTTCLAVYR